MSDIIYVLKKCKQDRDGKLYTQPQNTDRFYYPKRGWVEAPDFDEKPECGGGLHGLAWGEGDFYIQGYGDIFLVIWVDKNDGYVNLGDKVKFKKGYVVKYTKDSKEAIKYIKSKATSDHKYNYDQSSENVVDQGYRSTSNQGGWSTSNQGDWSTSNQGYSSTSNQGHRSTSNQGYSSTSNQGDLSTSNQGYSSTSNQGHRSTSNQGHRSTSNQGHSSTSNQGVWSTSNQGDGSTATVYGSEFVYRNRGGLSAIVMFCPYNMYIFQQGRDYEQNETVYITNNKIQKRYKGTPDNIANLEDHEVFVFGSNEAGNHTGGAAKLAEEKFGAESGTGEGLVGQSYAFPTLDKSMKQRSTEDLEKSIERLIKCACKNTWKVFLVTKVGCGIAGYEEEDMKALFDLSRLPANIVLPVDWYN